MESDYRHRKDQEEEGNRKKRQYALTRQAVINQPFEEGEMLIGDLVVNGRSIQITRHISKSLVKEVCDKFGLDGVDIDTVHTRLHGLNLKAVSPDTYGLIYYLPTEVPDLLATPISASTGVRLIDKKQEGTEVEVITYAGEEYHPQPYKFSLTGTLGCTAAANLGFFLLKELQGTETDRLEVLIIQDRDQLGERMKFGLPVADDPITEFCRNRGSERIVVK